MKPPQRFLMVLRHAKSSWESAHSTDHERTLNAQGREAAPKMARWMANHNWLPDQIVCSDARRTIETSQLLFATWSQSIPIVYSRELYLAPAENYLRAASQFADSVKRGLLIGHNPGVSILIEKVTSEKVAGANEYPASDHQPVVHMPTAALAIFRLTVDRWCELERLGTGGLRLVDFQVPKSLPPE